MEATEKVSRAYRRDKDRRVIQEAQRKNRIRLMPFREFIQRKDRVLTETVVGREVVGGITLDLPFLASQKDKDDAIAKVASTLWQFSEMGNVSLTAVAMSPYGEIID